MWKRNTWFSNLRDTSLILLLLLLSLLPALKYSFRSHPAEDAVILMRYSDHLAHGYGVVWNMGEKPVDGATDFLFMVLLAGLVRLGVGVEIAARLVGVFSHMLTVMLVYLIARKTHALPRWMAVVFAGYLAIGPGMGYAAAGFGTPFFALFVCTTWFFATKLEKYGITASTSWLFAGSSLIMSLIRPEGVFLTVFMLIAIMYAKDFQQGRKVVVPVLATFLTLGGTYFLWRWHYFGYPLPNPFYVKGSGDLHWISLAKATANTIILSSGIIWAFVLGLRSPRTSTQAIFALIPIVGFTAIWVLLSDAMNYLMRFQYPILPIALMSGPPLLTRISADWRLPEFRALGIRDRAVLICLAAMMGLGVIAVQQVGFGYLRRAHDGKYDVAMLLRGYRGKGYVIATTEAGLLPFYSGWRAVDAWGLSDQWIAHNGIVTESYLDRFKPEVIAFQAGFSPLVKPVGDDRWFEMVMTLKRYAERHGYTLAAAYGEQPYQTHYYWVKPGFPDSADMVWKIRNMDYCWYLSGGKSFNYALPITVNSPNRLQ